MRPVPHTVVAEWPEVRPGRFAATIRVNDPAGAQLALLGLPDETGVRLNGGRAGASGGPAAFRRALAAFGVPFDGKLGTALDVVVYDAGDVEPAPGEGEEALFETHHRVREAAAALHRLGLVPVCIGGGHDLSLPSIAALAESAGGAVGGINVDAHLDVRERVGSGMPFRRLIESARLDPTRFVELGLGRFVNDASDLEWARRQGILLVGADSVQDDWHRPEALFARACGRGAAFLSIDLDALDAGVAPGVSALNPQGLQVRTVAELAETAGAIAPIRHFDLMELSPENDIAGRTARIAAFLFLSFVAGFVRRPS